MYGDTNYSKEDREKQKQNKGMLKRLPFRGENRRTKSINVN